MHDLKVHNEQTFWSANFIAELYALGLRHVIISPGSRSTPLALAFACHPGIEKHIVVDERSAAFIALGIGMRTGYPAALVCTSGTAVANYFPAVIEAKMSEIPMLVLSADRPPEERDAGANQAIDQIHLFGNKAAYFEDVGMQDLSTNSLFKLRECAQNAWHKSTTAAGCSHINFPFRKPLEPDSEFLKSLTIWYNSSLKNPSPSTLNNIEDKISLDDETQNLISQSSRPVIICGPSNNTLAVANLVEYFSRFSVPILVEPGSTNRILTLSKNGTQINHFNALLRSESTCRELSPDLIIKIGGEPVGKGVETYLKYHKTVQSIHFHTYSRISNPAQLPQIRISAATGIFDSNEPQLVPDNSWLEKWGTKSDLVFKKREYELQDSDKFRDGDVHTALSDFITADDIIMVSNSFPVRDLDLFGTPFISQKEVYMNRGASGIDGITSTAIGLSLASNQSVLLITGDLAFLHDLNALLSFKLLNRRFTVVVINNNGGSIFRMLPAKHLDSYFTDYFETPQNINIHKICASFNVDSYRVSNKQQLKELLYSENLGQQCVIECVTDPDSSMQQRANIWSS